MYIDLNGVNLYYRKRGHGPIPFILLHGNGMDGTMFSVLSKQLSHHFTVYSIDSRGHGKSSPVEEYHYLDMMEDVTTFISAMNLDHPLVYGFSDGGIIALLLSIYHPELIRAIMISGTNTIPQGVKEEYYDKCCEEYEESGNPLTYLLVSEPQITTEQLNNIPIPVMMLVGEFDLIDPEHAEYMADVIPYCWVKLVRGEDHGSYAVNNPLLYKLLRPFLRYHHFM